MRIATYAMLETMEPVRCHSLRPRCSCADLPIDARAARGDMGNTVRNAQMPAFMKPGRPSRRTYQQVGCDPVHSTARSGR